MGVLQRLLDVKLNDRNRHFFSPALRKRFRVAKYHALVLNRNLRDGEGNRLARLVRELGKSRPVVLFYPDVPRSTCPSYQFCLVRGYRITNDSRRAADLVVRWKDATYYQPDAELCRLAGQQRVVNIRCNDIGKQRVDAIFARVFGYSSLVDPRTYAGPCVHKSDINGAHDGVIVDCPVEEPRDGVYQLLVDNHVDEHFVLDMRVPVIGDTIPFVLLWHKPAGDRFGHWVSRQAIARVDDVFSPGEHRNLLRFAHEIGLDYGDLDVLRDRTSGKIYVIDANNTPDWERPALPDPGDDVKMLARVFAASFGLEQTGGAAANP